MPQSGPRLQLLLTGDELMSGDTVDSNSALLARELSLHGLRPQRRITLGDERAELVEELRALTRCSDAVIVNGGLGPTIDDLTAEVLAEVAGVAISEHEEALAHLSAWCERRGLPLNDSNRKQAQLPRGAELIANPIGSAPGFCLEVGDCLVLCTPGVPGELRAMLPELCERLRARFRVTSQRDVLRLQTFGLGESTAQQLLLDRCPDWPQSVTLAFRAGAPQLEIKLIVDDEGHRPERERCRALLESLFGDHIIGEDDTRLAGRVIDLAREAGVSLTTAESCTGGMIAQMITQIPGSSDVFPGGFVTYSNALKESLLGVRRATLEGDGAVSEATVREMLAGALERTGADLGVAVSGIAGPGGGSADKPVGTVWLAWGSRDAMEAVCLHWPVERVLFQTMVAAAALDALRRRLLGIAGQSFYLQQRRVI
ncbi:MAG: CinA family nicotinamide mononucleotide deamidase-related protein [Halieaceae bacterium]|nr:CinA family nicotinamide mononucleotide deamidase-related protein [Halieaceae bacterium]